MILDLELEKEQLREEEKSLDNSKENIDAQPKKKRKPQIDKLLDQMTYEEEITDSEEHEETVHPPTPLFHKDTVYARSWDKESSTPEKSVRNKKNVKLEPVFEMENPDLTQKRIQLVSWTGAGSGKKDDIFIKVSDGVNWIECKLDPKNKIYLVGKMFREHDILRILEYSGSWITNNFNLVRM